MVNIVEQIYRSGLKFLTPLDSEKTYKMVVEEVLKLVDAQAGSILILDGKDLIRAYSSDPQVYTFQPRKRGFTYRVFKTRKPIVTTPAEMGKAHPELKSFGFKTYLAVPLTYKNTTVGVLTVIFKEDKKSAKNELDILKLFAPMASLAIRKTKLYAEIKEALESRDLFISMAAHEFRTPLTTITGYIGLLQSKLTGANTPESRWIEELSWEAHRMTLLLNELLEVERIKTGAFHYIWKEVPLRHIIRRALMDFRFTHPDHKVVIEDKLKGKGDKVIGDYDKLLQLLINLLDNAAKFSTADRNITVKLTSNSLFLSISVDDQGHGIAKEDLGRIFDKFQRGSHSIEGMGLGLFLVKNIIEKHKGEVVIKSKEGRGTTVIIKLPHIKNG